MLPTRSARSRGTSPALSPSATPSRLRRDDASPTCYGAPMAALERFDVAVVGAGAAGLLAGIWTGRSAPGARIVCLDGAQRLGAKILISGGGRCNVTHDVIDETAFFGGSRPAIRKVLGRFDVAATLAFFTELGVEMHRE